MCNTKKQNGFRRLVVLVILGAFFLSSMHDSYAQLKLFATTTSTADQNTSIYHLGNILIGTNNSSNTLGNLTVWKDLSAPANIGIGNPSGNISIGISHSNGAFAPIATPGDAVFKKFGTGDIIFNLSTSGSASNGSKKIYFGDESEAKILVVSNEGKVVRPPINRTIYR